MKTSSMSTWLRAAMISMTAAADWTVMESKRACASILSEVARLFFPAPQPQLKPVRVRRDDRLHRRRG